MKGIDKIIRRSKHTDTNEQVMRLIRKAHEENLTELNLSSNYLFQLPSEIKGLENLTKLNLSDNWFTQVPTEIFELKNLTELNLSSNDLTRIPSKIIELKNLTEFNISSNDLIQIPPEIVELKNLKIFILPHNKINSLSSEIGELKNLTELNLSANYLTQLPPEIGKLRNLTILNLSANYLTQLPPEIGKLRNLTNFLLYNNTLTSLPPEIGELKNLTELDLSGNQLTWLPSEIEELENLTELIVYNNKLASLSSVTTRLKNFKKINLHNNRLTELPSDIEELVNLTELDLSYNELERLPPEIGNLKNLTVLNIHHNHLSQLPPEIFELKSLTVLNIYHNHLTLFPYGIKKLRNLKVLNLSENKLTLLPSEIGELEKLEKLNFDNNPLTSPPPEIISMGLEAILTYLKQSKTTEHNEAKLILVGNGDVGKTCLAHRLINDEFLEDSKVTEGIHISKWNVPAPNYINSEIKLNIWDFGGQEIYHATHQFFLTTRSVYLLVWNARKTKDFDNIYYWLHTIEAFGGESPILLVMSKMNESDDDLNLKDLKNKFPQIVGYLKIDSKDGKGISFLNEKIRETAWSLPLMRARWVDSWYRVRQKLEALNENWITYSEFYRACILEGLDDKNVSVLDEYLHELGVTLHFKDRIALKNIVILKPEWATGAFYKILSTKSVLYREGVLLTEELGQIWDKQTYPADVYPQLMELMNKFELSYELPDKRSYLIPELLPKSEPDDFSWDYEDNLCIYYCYDYFLPPGIIPRFIVRMHQNLEIKENGLPLCWREGAVLIFRDSHVLVKMNLDEKLIEIRVKGDNEKWVMGAVCSQLDQINASIKKIKVSEQIPCNCSKNCKERHSYDKLLNAVKNNVETILCLESFKPVDISVLLEGYKIREERRKGYEEPIQPNQTVVLNTYSPTVIATSNTKQTMDVKIDVNINLELNLQQIQTDFEKLRREIKNSYPELKNEVSIMDEIQDSLDEVSADDEKKVLTKAFKKLRRFLVSLGDPDSDTNKIITGTQKGAELAQKVVETFNKVAPLLGIALLHGVR